MNQATSPARRSILVQLVLGIAVLALLAYYFWPRDEAPAAAPAVQDAVATAPPAAAPSTTGPAVRNEGGILLDAQGNRVLNAAGLPGTEPLPPAKPIPIKSAPNDVVGYAVDANGVSRPIRAKDIRGAANTPGTYAAVDMWADGGPAVVTPTRGKLLSEAEVEKARAEERAREARARARAENQ